MRVLGIDPGSVVAGYGLVDNTGGQLKMVDCGVVKISRRLPPAERLNQLYQALSKIVTRYQPDAIAVETPFVASNVSSALAIGRAQAVAMLIAASHKIAIFEYTPAQVKQRVTSYGASSKEQIQQMVRLQLGLPGIPEPSDAADALAVALCHLSEAHISQLLNQKPEKERRSL